MAKAAAEAAASEATARQDRLTRRLREALLAQGDAEARLVEVCRGAGDKRAVVEVQCLNQSVGFVTIRGGGKRLFAAVTVYVMPREPCVLFSRLPCVQS